MIEYYDDAAIDLPIADPRTITWNCPNLFMVDIALRLMRRGQARSNEPEGASLLGVPAGVRYYRIIGEGGRLVHRILYSEEEINVAVERLWRASPAGHLSTKVSQ